MQQFDDKIDVSPSLISLQSEIRGDRGTVNTKLPEQMVCGFVSTINSNEQIPARLIDSLTSLAALPFEGTIYFEKSAIGERLMGLFFTDYDLIGVRPVVLKGYPDATASAAFDQYSWDELTVSYSDLVSDIVASTRVDKMMTEEAGERQKRPPKEQLLTRDRTKHFDSYIQANDEDDHAE